MRLAEIPPATAVFVDASVFIYHFAGQSDEASTFLARVESSDLSGVTSGPVLLEVAHRLMVLEAMERGVKGSNPAVRLAQRPDLVRSLFKYYFAATKIPQMGIQTLSTAHDVLARSQEYRQAYGLLVNDSLIPVYMRDAGVTVLASADASFDRVPWIRRAAPSDI